MPIRLYTAPGSCSSAVHIALREAGLEFESVRVDLRKHKLADGSDFYAINSKGYVPVLELEDGERLTEVPALLMYVADRAPEKNLAPAAGTSPRYRLKEWLAFIGTEVHKSFSPIFAPGTSDEVKAQARARVLQRLTWVDEQLAGRTYLLREQFSVADIYLFVASGWSKFAQVDLSRLERLNAYLGRIAARPAVQAALRADGLIQ